MSNRVRPSNFVVPFPPACTRCQASAAAPSTQRSASRRFCPPHGYPRFIGRCFLGTMRPSDSLHRVGPASHYACAVPTLTALRMVSGHRSVRCHHEHRCRHLVVPSGRGATADLHRPVTWHARRNCVGPALPDLRDLPKIQQAHYPGRRRHLRRSRRRPGLDGH